MSEVLTSPDLREALTIIRGHVSADGGDIRTGVERSLDGDKLAIIAKAMAHYAALLQMPRNALGTQHNAPAEALAAGINRTADAKPTEVLLVDTVASSGNRLLATARNVTKRMGATVVGAMPLVDLGEGARELFAEEMPNVKYRPVFTPRNL